jgi:hypothetical protein
VPALAVNAGAQFVAGAMFWVHSKEVSQTVGCERERVSLSGYYAAKPKARIENMFEFSSWRWHAISGLFVSSRIADQPTPITGK